MITLNVISLCTSKKKNLFVYCCFVNPREEEPTSLLYFFNLPLEVLWFSIPKFFMFNLVLRKCFALFVDAVLD